MVHLKDGAKKFIEYVCAVAGRSDCCPHSGLVRGVTVSFSDFIKIISKFTRTNNVDLNGKIAPIEGGQLHSFVLWGIRDPGVRKGGAARYLPDRQTAIWSTILEDALCFGLSGEEVSQFRHSLNLLPEHGISDDEFFQMPVEIPLL